MVRRIYIIESTLYLSVQNKIISIHDFCSGKTSISGNYKYVFEDRTTNFKDLLYWSSDDYFIGKNLNQAISNIINVLDKLKIDGYQPRVWTDDDENSITNPSWIWGHSNIRNGLSAIILPNDERKSILMFHLHNCLHFLREIKNKHVNEINTEYILLDDPEWLT